MAILLVVCVVLWISNCPSAEAHIFEIQPNRLSKYLEGYTDVCACANVPFVANYTETWSINSNGKELLAYFEPNCLQKTSKAQFTVDTHGKNVIDVFKLEEMNEIKRQNRYRIRSFGPDPNSEMFKTRCKNNANVAIMGLEMLETDSKLAKPITYVNADMVTSPKNSHPFQEYDHLIHLFGLANFKGIHKLKI